MAIGACPTLPAANCAFCSLTARITSRRRHLELRQAIRQEPDPHRVVLGAEDLHVGRARQPLQLVEHVQRDVVRDEQIVVAAVGRVERDHLQERRAAALDRHALPPHFLGQPRLDLLHAVVDVDRGVVDVGADLERDLDLHDAVGRRRRAHVDHVRHAVDRVLDRRGDGLLERLGRRARIDRLHGHDRRRDLRVLRDGQRAHRRQAREHQEHGDHGREDRPVDEEAREHGLALTPWAPAPASGGALACGRCGAAACRPPELDRRAGPQLGDAVDDHLVAGLQAAVSTTHRFVPSSVTQSPSVDRAHRGDRPCRPCPCRRRTRTCPARRPSRRPAARRARCCARRPGASRARTGRA